MRWRINSYTTATLAKNIYVFITFFPLFSRSLKGAFSRHDNAQIKLALRIWLNENVHKQREFGVGIGGRRYFTSLRL